MVSFDRLSNMRTIRANMCRGLSQGPFVVCFALDLNLVRPQYQLEGQMPSCSLPSFIFIPANHRFIKIYSFVGNTFDIAMKKSDC